MLFGLFETLRYAKHISFYFRYRVGDDFQKKSQNVLKNFLNFFSRKFHNCFSFHYSIETRMQSE